MGYELGRRSRAELEGVQPPLVRVVEAAIAVTTQDFTVYDGLRTPEEQRRYVAQGRSRTMNSRHLTGDAVDLVPYVAGRLLWEWPLIWPVAEAMRTAAAACGVRLRWGGVWDRALTDLDGPLEDAVRDYCTRHPGPDFIDGPHFELAG